MLYKKLIFYSSYYKISEETMSSNIGLYVSNPLFKNSWRSSSSSFTQSLKFNKLNYSNNIYDESWRYSAKIWWEKYVNNFPQSDIEIKYDSYINKAYHSQKSKAYDETPELMYWIYLANQK